MANTTTQKTYASGSQQNFLGHEVEESFDIAGDGVGSTVTLTPKRLRTIDYVNISKDTDIVGFNFVVTNTIGAPTVAIVIPAGLAVGKSVHVRLRGQFQ